MIGECICSGGEWREDDLIFGNSVFKELYCLMYVIVRSEEGGFY